jgi:hypothetical protein
MACVSVVSVFAFFRAPLQPAEVNEILGLEALGLNALIATLSLDMKMMQQYYKKLENQTKTYS